VFFVIGSISCGLAQSMAMLVGSRALQGIGGGITVTASALIGGRPDRQAVEAALEHIAHRVLAQRDWHDDTPSTAALPAASCRPP
jgi:hypothetical protein